MAEGKLSTGEEFPARSFEDWRARVEGELGRSVETLRRQTPGGLEVDALYDRPDRPEGDPAGFPGLFPYARGSRVLGHTRSGVFVCPQVDHPSPDEAAVSVRDHLEQGADALWLRLGLDHGTRMLTAGDLEHVLASTEPGRVPLYFEPGPDPFAMASTLVAWTRAHDAATEALTGCLGADPLGTLARTGSLHSGADGSFEEVSELLSWSQKHAPSLQVLVVSTSAYHDAGASMAQELGFGLATGIEYLERCVRSGHDVAAIAPRILLSYSIGNDFFLQIAKLRAARVLWAKALAAFGLDHGSVPVNVHARTSDFTKTQRDPWVNMVRGTAEGFAAVVGGADLLTVTGFDAAIGPSDAFGRRIARNTELVLHEESQLHRTIDPAGGSYFVERVTDELARKGWDVMQAVCRDGGMKQALARGRIRREIGEVAMRRKRELATRRAAVVGVSVYPSADETLLERPVPEGADVEDRIGRSFGNVDVRQRYARLVRFARVAGGQEPGGPDARFEAAVEAAQVGVDLFSLGSVLRSGRPSLHVPPVERFRSAEPWERLRDASEMFTRIKGRRPRAFVALLGPLKERRLRTEWVLDWLAAGGVDAVEGDPSVDAEALATGLRDDGATVAVLCGHDDRYREVGAEAARSLAAAGATRIIVAGKPGEDEDAMRGAGVTDFAFRGADVLALLQAIHDALGVSP
jgi:methylmalonyl-CoA mutase